MSLMSVPREVSRLGLAANDSFRGVHAFDPAVDYAALFPRFLTGRARRPPVMCHPGFVDARLRAVDAVTDQRRWTTIISPPSASRRPGGRPIPLRAVPGGDVTPASSRAGLDRTVASAVRRFRY